MKYLLLWNLFCAIHAKENHPKDSQQAAFS